VKRARPPHLTRDVDRHGNARWYVRRPGKPKIRIRAEYGTDAFWIAYRDAMAGKSDPAPKKPAKPAPDTLRGLCTVYFGSPEFGTLDPSTRRVRRALLERVCLMKTASGQELGDLPFRLMQPKHLRTVRDRLAATPGAANGIVKAVRQVYAFAIAREMATANPAKEVPYLPAVRQDGIAAWTADDVRKFEEAHPIGTKARLALMLFTELGQRISDVHRLGWSMFDGDELTFRQHKNRNRRPVDLTLIFPEHLRAVLNQTPHGTETFLVNDFGVPFASTAAFGNKFRDWCRAAGLEGKSAHGLRKYFAATLAEKGASDREIMAMTGHKTSKEVDRYTRSASQKRLAKNASERMKPAIFVPPISGKSESETKIGPKSLKANDNKGVMVPRDGVEPPTRGFSIRCSTS